jgi:hypothetical protein
LQEWLESLQLGEYFNAFVREDITLQVLSRPSTYHSNRSNGSLSSINTDRIHNAHYTNNSNLNGSDINNNNNNAEEEENSDAIMNTILDHCNIHLAGVRVKIIKAAKALQGMVERGVVNSIILLMMSLLTEKNKRKAFDQAIAKAKRRSSYGEATPEQLARIARLRAELIKEGQATDDTWMIEHDDLEFLKELGVGTSATVFKGIYKGDKVAIKVLKSLNIESIADIKKELLVLRYVCTTITGENKLMLFFSLALHSTVHSPYIVHFYGACFEPKVCMVLEYCKLGSLYTVLRDPSFPMSWQQAFRFMRDMTNGLHCLHTWTPPVVHRDIKSPNLLVYLLYTTTVYVLSHKHCLTLSVSDKQRW